MPSELESTIELARHIDGKLIGAGGTQVNADGNDLSNSRVAIQAGGNSEDLTRRFQETTRKLLRKRLIAASITLTCLILVVFLLTSLFDRPTFELTVMRAFSFFATFGLYAYLSRLPDASLSLLRKSEIVLVAIPISEACLAQVFETNRLFSVGLVDEIPTLHAIIGTAVAVFITVYGMFVPAKWHRTAIITGCMAIVPTAVALLQTYANPELVNVGIPNFTTSVLLFMMVIVATIGSRLVHATRREVVSARQYGQYQLKEEIGRGGMGVVYRAEHRMLKRPAAIKLIRGESAYKEDAIARFESEVQLSATLSHWNTVQIYDYGRTQNGDFYYVMEHLDGESLHQRIKRVGPVEVSQTVSYMKQLCDGLAEAHERGMVHRDLKPGNIFLANTGGQNGVVKILDFGLAVESKKSTESSGICGSPPYMSPEQIMGQAVDRRSDIYAIGCIMFECLTGNLLFKGDSIEDVIRMHLHEMPDLAMLDGCEKNMRPIIERCLNKSVADRISTVDELKTELANLEMAESV